MPDPTEPKRTVAAPQDQPPAVASDTDATGPYDASRPNFGPPTAVGEVGTLGPYRVVKELGKGGMGAVYLALDTRLDRKLALKVMLPEFAADLDAKGRFLREAKAAAKVNHDHVVTVYEADERDGVPYIAMQFLQGYPLDEYLKTKGAPALAHVIRIGREAALGLAAAHEMGLVHRDIKPANLWLEAPHGRVKVLDFGLAKPIGTETELTKSGAVIGTPAYMSPEQARGLKVDHRTDLFSLGAVLYKLCTGKPPFAGEHVMAVLAALIADEPTSARELNPDVSEALAALIHQLLSKKPEQRPQTAADVADRLRTVLEHRAPADVSASQPVVVHPLPVVVPMQVTVRPEDAFANLDVGDEEATHAEPAEAVAVPPKKGVLLASGVAVLLAVVVGVVVAGTMNKGKKQPEAKAPNTEVPAPVARPELATPVGPLPATHKNGIGMEFVKVPKGTGWLGGGGGKPGETKVTFDQDFYLGKYEVAQEEWEKVMERNPSHFSRTGAGKDAVKGVSDAELRRFPVEQASWDDCQVFIERLNKREKESGWVYRLPKADEWEYACRGGLVDKLDSAFDFYFAKPTNTLWPGRANFEFGQGLKRTCRVGSYEPNLLGVYDMHGNVWEWCEDAENMADGASARVDRGGSWHGDSGRCRAALRSANPPSVRSSHLGLRVTRVPVASAGK